MSMGYSGRVWACPFFRWDERKGVHCEGGCVSFQSGKTYSDYIKRYCCRVEGWEDCTLAKALVEQCERKEKRET